MRSPLVTALLLLATACTNTAAPTPEDTTTEENQLSIVTTVAPITNLVHNIAGDLANVSGLVPEGVNSHTFEPAPSDAAVLADADLFFANGLHLEVPSLELAEQNLPAGARIVTLAEQTIQERAWIFDFSFPREGGDPNPHLWTNPAYAKRYAIVIADALARQDPENARTYLGNAEVLSERFDALAEAAEIATSTVPEDARKLLTYHDSFPYFARAFGWEIIGAIQPSDFSEPTAREVGDLIEQIEREQIPAIFGSEVFPSPVLEAIAAETGATYVDDLRDDDLPGELDDANHSLLGLLVFDYTTLVEALGGDASAFDAVDTSNLHPEATVSYR